MNRPSMFKTADGKSYGFTFLLITSLFFLWAVCNGMIDVMDKHFQDFLHLSKAQSANVQFAHYLGYFLMALPAGWLARRFGYKGGIIVGLMMVAIGCLWFIPATKISAFWAFLLGVCVISMGLTFLETIANPYTTVLGAPQFAAVRINLAQSANGVGWILGPIIGGLFFYADPGIHQAHIDAGTHQASIANCQPCQQKKADLTKDLANQRAKLHKHHLHAEPSASPLEACAACAEKAESWLKNELSKVDGKCHVCITSAHHTVWIPYAVIAVIVILLSFVFVKADIPDIVNEDDYHLDDSAPVPHKSIWAHSHFTGAVISQFVYVAAQAGIFSFFINYIVEDMPALTATMKSSWSFLVGGASGSEFRNGAWFATEQGATKLLSIFGFSLFLLGRFTGAGLLNKLAAHKALGLYALANVVLMGLIVARLEWVSVVALFLSFFFMSIMFPTIFALGIHGLGEKSKVASSFIVMAIMGGALLPKLMGKLGDDYGMSAGFAVPAGCFVIIAIYGFSWCKLSGSEGLLGHKPTGGH
ncbi:MAG: MFS transporter [Verrucomicrobia bacterium]|nr:MFS transporter [Verrucomicrobiota bacterium]